MNVFAQAAELCREILAATPTHAPVLHLLGTIEHAAGRDLLVLE